MLLGGGKMNQCAVCKTYVDSKYKYCKYCGYKYSKYETPEDIISMLKSVYNDYPSIDNEDNLNGKISITKNRSRLSNSNQFKCNIIKNRIKEEIEKYNTIKAPLDKISNNKIKEKIDNILTPILKNVNELTRILVNIEFNRFQEDFRIINNSIDVDAINDENELASIIESEMDKYMIWTKSMNSELPKLINQENEMKILDEKYKKAINDIKEKYYIRKLNVALKKTSLVESECTLAEESRIYSMNNYDSEIEEIEYEIDRLNAELEMKNLTNAST